ncbi:MAG: hypothetical protein COB22_00080 [Cycloclasticus sp.]|nr:MAG: hypothetical protein COB22_00080 [Cycloclasticus sp.]
MPTNSFIQKINKLAKAYPNRLAILASGYESLTYAKLSEYFVYVANTLKDNGIKKNDRIVIVLPNGPEMGALSMAVSSYATCAPLNPEYKTEEFNYYLKDLNTRLLITHSGMKSPAVQEATALNIPVLELDISGDLISKKFVHSGDLHSLNSGQVHWATDSDVALILHTSGTTALPKKVPLTHSNLAASAINVSASLGLNSEDICLNLMPMFHIGGLVDLLYTPLLQGSQIICAANFSFPEFKKNMELYSPSWCQMVPTMIQEITSQDNDELSFMQEHSLRFVRSVSSALPEKLKQQCEGIFKTPVIEVYGMSETAGQITCNPLPPGIRKSGSVGQADGTEVRILDNLDVTTKQNVIGEVLVRGNNVMLGYEYNETPIAKDFLRKWFKTGDMGYLDDDNYLFLTGRIKEIINRGGEKLLPQEVDKLALTHPSIEEAVTFPIPHEALGEEVAIAVVLKNKKTLDKKDLTNFLSQHLSYYKVPKSVYFIDKIPKTIGGKLKRNTLHQLMEQHFYFPAENTHNSTSEAPLSPIAKFIASLWEEALRIKEIGLNDDFFDLGGDSLKAAIFINKIQEKWNEIIYVTALFENPSLVEFEAYLIKEHPILTNTILGNAINPKTLHRTHKLSKETIQHFKQSIANTSSSTRRITDKKIGKTIFILSPPRSGSTLLRVMLAGNNLLFSPPELHLAGYANMTERKEKLVNSQEFRTEGLIRTIMQLDHCNVNDAKSLVQQHEKLGTSTQQFYALLQHRTPHQLLIDKTPSYSLVQSTLQCIDDIFDNAIFIHLTRHPYGMIRSFEEAHLDQLWFPYITGKEINEKHQNPYQASELGELIWLSINRNINHFLAQIPNKRKYHLRYEDTVHSPQQEMIKLCEFLDIEFNSGMLSPQDKQSSKMTDGLYEQSRMIGDMKFHLHSGISTNSSDLWKSAYQNDFLCDETWQLAHQFGYHDTVINDTDREELEI